MALPVAQSSAVCCWCQSPLVQVASAPGIWWCVTAECSKQQLAWAISRQLTEWIHEPGKRAEPKTTWERLFVPTPRQVDYLANPAKYRLFGGAAGPGKSHAARMGLYRRALSIPNFEALILRETFPELERTHLRRMAQEAEWFGATYTDSKRQLRFENGSIIEGGHLEDEAAVRKYLSSEYDHIIADEGSSFEPKALLEVSTRARTSKPAVLSNGGSRFDVVSNPGGRAAGMLRDLFIDHQPDADAFPMLAQEYDASEWAFIPATLDDNPYLDPGYVRALAVLQPWRYEQLRHGNWNIFAGQFFASFNERRHTRILDIREPEHATWFRSLDWGYHDPMVVLWWVVLPDHHLHIAAELKLKEHVISDAIEEVRAMDRTLGLPTPVAATRTYADPAVRQRQGQSGESILETFGKNTPHMPLIPSVNERRNGWMRIQSLLRDAPDGTPWLTIDPTCKYTVRSLSQAISDPKEPDDIDPHTDDHALDALRYGAMSRPMPQYAQKTERAKPGMAGHLLDEVLASQASSSIYGTRTVMHG